MRKRDELEAGCMSKARPDEMTFVLLGRDKAAPQTIRFWAAERVRSGLNAADDDKITEALDCAATIEREHIWDPTMTAYRILKPWLSDGTAEKDAHDN